jgi:hypothetical protein
VNRTTCTHSEPLQNFGPSGIVIRKPLVLFAVELDEELRGVAIEIDDVTIERDLPPESCAVKPRAAQAARKNVLGARRLFAQLASELNSF